MNSDVCTINETGLNGNVYVEVGDEYQMDWDK